MKIFVDMDNTLNDFLNTFIDRVPDKLKLHVNDRSFFDLIDYVNLPTKEARRRYCDLEYENPDFWLSMKPLPYSQETLKMIKDFGHTLIIATALPKNKSDHCIDVIKDSKIKWLDKYFSSIFEDVIFTKEKYLLQGDILIDDCVLSAYSKDGKRFNGEWWMPVYPYNRMHESKADLIFLNWHLVSMQKKLKNVI